MATKNLQLHKARVLVRAALKDLVAERDKLRKLASVDTGSVRKRLLKAVDEIEVAMSHAYDVEDLIGRARRLTHAALHGEWK